MTNEENIKKLEEQLNTMDLPAFLKIKKMNVLKLLYYNNIKDTNKNDKYKCAEVDKIANDIIDLGYNNIKEMNIAEQSETYKIIKENYQFLGRRHLKEFMISIEWDFNQDMKFYDIRQMVFDEWIDYLEKLEYGDLNGLSISAPPRSRENRYRNDIFYVVYVKASGQELFLCITYGCYGKKSL